MGDIAVNLVVALLAAIATLLGVWIKGSADRHTADRSADAELEDTRGRLALELLQAARVERADMQAEIDRWKSLAAHLDDFEMALAHIEALLLAEGEKQRQAVERAARLFLERIQQKRRATSLIRSEAQLAASAANLAGDERRG